MAWHIFKKDFRLLWPLSLAVVLLGALNALRTWFDGHFYETQSLVEQLTIFLSPLVRLGIAIVAVSAVHQDALSESQSDWLVRPLGRRDLALGKVLFVLLTVNVPLMIIDVVLQLVLHFPLYTSIGVAAVRALLLVCLYSLPALMIGAVTRSLVNAFVLGIAFAIGFALILIVATSTLSPAVLGFSGAGTWISLWFATGVLVIGSAATLTLQYSTRRTLLARSIGSTAVFAALAVWVLFPGKAALLIQESLWGPPNSDGISLTFRPSEPGTRTGANPRPGNLIVSPMSAVAEAAAAALAATVDRRTEKVELPLSVSGMRPGDILISDRIDIRLISMTGKLLYRGAGVCAREGSALRCSPNRLEVRASSGSSLNEEELNLPIGLYQRIKDEPVRVEVSYALTRLAPRPTQMIKAVGDLKDLPEMGSCATRVDSDGDEVQMGCLTDVEATSCASVVLEDPQTNQRNPELHQCRPRYLRGGLRDAVDRVQLSIPFRDLSGLAHYPVDGAALAHARIDVTVYNPVAHFRTYVTVPSVRLVEWAPPKGASALARN